MLACAKTVLIVWNRILPCDAQESYRAVQKNGVLNVCAPGGRRGSMSIAKTQCTWRASMIFGADDHHGVMVLFQI